MGIAMRCKMLFVYLGQESTIAPKVFSGENLPQGIFPQRTLETAGAFRFPNPENKGGEANGECTRS